MALIKANKLNMLNIQLVNLREHNLQIQKIETGDKFLTTKIELDKNYCNYKKCFYGSSVSETFIHFFKIILKIILFFYKKYHYLHSIQLFCYNF